MKYLPTSDAWDWLVAIEKIVSALNEVSPYEIKVKFCSYTS